MQIIFSNAEKNWMRFQMADGTPHFIRSLDPYMIVRDSGKAAPELLERVQVPLFHKLTKGKRLALHGGSNPVLIGGRSPKFAPGISLSRLKVSVLG